MRQGTLRPWRSHAGLVSLLVTLLLLLALVLTLVNLQRQQLGFDDFALTDWLIAYDGAFVRRGLGGELLWQFERVSGIAMPITVFVIAAVAYVLLTVTAIRLAWRFNRLAELLLLVSPATAFFTAFEPGAAGRKELLLLLIPALFLWRPSGQPPGRTQLLLLTAALSCLLLLHEGLFFFYPLLGVFFWIYWGCPPRPWALLGRPALMLTLLMAMITLLNRLYPPNVQALCDLLAVRHYSLAHCAEPLMTAVSWLDVSVAQVWSLLDGRMTIDRLISVVTGLLLTALPVALLPWRRDVARVAMLATACTLPLFVVAIDWGRWLYVISTLLLYIYAAAWVGRGQQSDRIGPRVSVLTAFVLVCWVSAWQLLHCCVMGAEWGLVAKVAALATHWL
ncbi:MAG: hypothetical protein V4624_03960 [Pseudomonadota bacterium]